MQFQSAARRCPGAFGKSATWAPTPPDCPPPHHHRRGVASWWALVLGGVAQRGLVGSSGTSSDRTGPHRPQKPRRTPATGRGQRPRRTRVGTLGTGHSVAPRGPQGTFDPHRGGVIWAPWGTTAAKRSRPQRSALHSAVPHCTPLATWGRRRPDRSGLIWGRRRRGAGACGGRWRGARPDQEVSVPTCQETPLPAIWCPGRCPAGWPASVVPGCLLAVVWAPDAPVIRAPGAVVEQGSGDALVGVRSGELE
jgi:hypothetical protein